LSNGSPNGTAGSRALPFLPTSGLDGTAGLKTLCGMLSGCGGEWTLRSRRALLRRGLSNGAANGTAGSRALPVHPISRRFGEKCGTPRSGARDDGWGWKCALKRCSPAAVVPTLPKTGEGWGSLVWGRSEKVKGVGQECPTHTVIEQAGLIRWSQHSNRARAGDPALPRPRLSPAIRTDNPKKLLARRGRRV
jgi:hypothetical protein